MWKGLSDPVIMTAIATAIAYLLGYSYYQSYFQRLSLPYVGLNLPLTFYMYSLVLTIPFVIIISYSLFLGIKNRPNRRREVLESDVIFTIFSLYPLIKLREAISNQTVSNELAKILYISLIIASLIIFAADLLRNNSILYDIFNIFMKSNGSTHHKHYLLISLINSCCHWVSFGGCNRGI